MKQAKLITCIVAKGKAVVLQSALIEQKGIHSANIRHGRGVGRFAPLSERGIGEQLVKEIVEISVDSAIADEIFEFLFFEAEINQPHAGVMYMTHLPSASDFIIPDIDEAASD